jgi:hypothetical protein
MLSGPAKRAFLLAIAFGLAAGFLATDSASKEVNGPRP